MSPTPYARTVRRLRERRGHPVPTSGLRRLWWIVATGDTQFTEGAFSSFAIVRGVLMLHLRASAFGPTLTPLLAAAMPMPGWALASFLPGLFQLGALSWGSVQFRRWAAYSNVGISVALAVVWFLTAPNTLGVAFYGFLAVVQLVIAIRLAAEPDTSGPDTGGHA